MFWNKKNPKPEITLDDVVPLHPDAYPARHLRARLAADRERLMESRGFFQGRDIGFSGHV